MMMLLLGFYEPTIGAVKFEGKDIWKLDKAETIEFPPQRPGSIPGSIRCL